MLSLAGGYAFAIYADTETNAPGWRINGVYEWNRKGGKVTHGINFGFIGTSAFVGSVSELDLNTWPLYYSAKVIFGESKFKASVKGALGLHYSHYESSGGSVEIISSDQGFYGGASAGAMYFLKENIFLNAEYELAFISNSFYKNGMMNSIMLGLGIKL